MVTESDRALILHCYTNFNARATEAVLQVMHPEVDWPNGMDGGRVHGHEGIREYWSRQWSLIDPHVEPVDLNSSGPGQVTVLVHQIVRELGGSVIVDQMVEHTYLIENGLIRRMQIGNDASSGFLPTAHRS